MRGTERQQAATCSLPGWSKTAKLFGARDFRPPPLFLLLSFFPFFFFFFFFLVKKRREEGGDMFSFHPEDVTPQH